MGLSGGLSQLSRVRERLKPAPTVRLDGRRVRASTWMARIGAYQVALTTVLPDRAVELHSTFLGHDAVSESAVTHLLLSHRSSRIEARRHPQSHLPVVAARSRCLYDHLEVLAEFLRELGWRDVLIDVDDGLLVKLDP